MSDSLLKRIWERYKNLSPLVRFLINGILFYGLWILFYSFLRYQFNFNQIYSKITYHLTNSWLYSTRFFLELLGFDIIVEKAQKAVKIVEAESIKAIVVLKKGCLGRNLLGLFIGFIIAYPGKISHKLWYIPVGLVAFYLLNTIRIAGLALAIYYYPEAYKSYNHHDIFKYATYAMIFLLWYIYIAKLSTPVKPQKSKVEVASS